MWHFGNHFERNVAVDNNKLNHFKESKNLFCFWIINEKPEEQFNTIIITDTLKMTFHI